MSTKKTIGHIFKVTVSLIFLGYLYLKIDWNVIGNILYNVDLSLYLFSTILAIVGIFIVAIKYYILIKDTSISQTIIFLFRINFIIRFYSLFLPSSLGAEAVRWYKVTRNERGRALFLASSSFERVIFVFLLLLTGTLSLFLYSSDSKVASFRESALPLILIFIVLTFIFITYLVSPVIQSFVRFHIKRFLPPQGKWQSLNQFLENFSLKDTSMSLSCGILALSLLWQVLYVVRIFFLIQALGQPLGIIDAAFMGSLVLLLQTLPLSLSGLGVREGAYAYLFTLLDLPPEQGISVGLLFLSQMLTFSIIGGVIEWFET